MKQLKFWQCVKCRETTEDPNRQVCVECGGPMVLMAVRPLTRRRGARLLAGHVVRFPRPRAIYDAVRD